MAVGFWFLFALCVAILFLVGIKGFGWARKRVERASTKFDQFAGEQWTTQQGKIDEFVADSRRLWPALRVQWMFWIALLTLLGMVILNVYFGLVVSGWKLSIVTFVLIIFFSAADIVLAVRAVEGDRGDGAWYEFKTGDRPTADWVLISICTALSMLVVVLSTGDIHRGVAAKQDVTQSKWTELRNQMEAMTTQRETLQNKRTARGGLSRQALEIKAAEAKDRADREAARIRCASECEKKKREYEDLAEQAADARTEDELTEKIAAIQAQLAVADDIKEGSDTVEDIAASIGTDYKTFKKWMFVLIGLVFALVNTMLWLKVGDEAGKIRAAEYAKRAERGDEIRATLSLPPKYTAALESMLSLPAPDASSGDTIVVNITQAEDMRRRYANDHDLLEVDSLFGTLLEPVEGASLTKSELYRLYRVDVLRRDPSARYMTEPTMINKLFTISQHRDDIKVTGDGRILGWVAKQTAVAAE